ncbi:fatty acid desaturase [Spirulina sp. CS-785/01]|uniref:fatty acid desaturase n=1 Tax=Spirulina sp. CS-785/01 TaxID=3021716 RepID=UPI00232D1921|nr:fatty acid desaturase [Spirulina sp. CS-785/01]MDB9315768.1 fatty acid desaturase [Spirulina sp. CS-785/01]
MTATKIPSNPSLISSEITELRLRDIVKTLPKEVFQQDRRKAWLQVTMSVIAVAVGYFAIALLPWYFLPLSWFFTGTALTGWFVIGHDCGHRSFAKRKWVNNWVGHLAFLPLLYPFHSWRIFHNQHHQHTNNIDIDNAWTPFKPEDYETFPRPLQWGYQVTRGWFWWLASIAHWFFIHFNWQQLKGKNRNQVKFSVLVTLMSVAIAFPILILATGWWGFVKFWLIPWLVFHFWMSTFTLVHHTDPEIPFVPHTEWQDVKAQLEGTVHCEYPAWVELLCHDINVHIPHHITTAIPSYNLRAAYKSIRENWGQYCKEKQFSLQMLKEIVTHCHLYDDLEYYRAFQSDRK